MSKTAVEEILRKASSDAKFRARLQRDFDVAVKPYTLTAAEKKQLQTSAGSSTAAVSDRQAARALSRVEGRAEARSQGRVLQRKEARIEGRNMKRIIDA